MRKQIIFILTFSLLAIIMAAFYQRHIDVKISHNLKNSFEPIVIIKDGQVIDLKASILR